MITSLKIWISNVAAQTNGNLERSADPVRFFFFFIIFFINFIIFDERSELDSSSARSCASSALEIVVQKNNNNCLSPLLSADQSDFLSPTLPTQIKTICLESSLFAFEIFSRFSSEATLLTLWMLSRYSEITNAKDDVASETFPTLKSLSSCLTRPKRR